MFYAYFPGSLQEILHVMNLCMYVCMHLSIYLCMYACMHVCMYVCMFGHQTSHNDKQNTTTQPQSWVNRRYCEICKHACTSTHNLIVIQKPSKVWKTNCKMRMTKVYNWIIYPASVTVILGFFSPSPRSTISATRDRIIPKTPGPHRRYQNFQPSKAHRYSGSKCGTK